MLRRFWLFLSTLRWRTGDAVAAIRDTTLHTEMGHVVAIERGETFWVQGRRGVLLDVTDWRRKGLVAVEDFTAWHSLLSRTERRIRRQPDSADE